jgi:transcriptional regulator with XRE-family HTH domain
MVTRVGPVRRALRVASEDEAHVRRDLRDARLAAGLSRETVGQVIGLPRSAVERLELGSRRTTLAEYAAFGSAVGHDVRLPAYPAGDPIRDAGQQRLLERFRAHLAPSLRWRTEVVLPGDADLRAWDAETGGTGWRLPIDAETVLDDVQAVERRVHRKQRDDRADHVLVLVSDTKRNRRALAAAPAAFGGFSRDARAVLKALREGRDRGTSAVILV